MPSGSGSRLHRVLPDVSTPHALVDLVPAVASEAEVDSRVATHAGLPDVHHIRSHDHALAADGSPIAVAGIPTLPITRISDWDRQSFTNLLVNGDFEVGDPPTGWLVAGTLVRSTAQVRIGAFSGALTNAAGAEGVARQWQGNLAYFSGRTVSMGAWIWANVPGRVRLDIFDEVAGVGWEASSSPNHPGDSTWRWLFVTRTLRVGIINWHSNCLIISGTSTTAFFDGAILVEGSICPAFSPRPAEFRNISASEVVSERFPMDRMLDGPAGQYIRGAGAGVNPGFSAIPEGDIPATIARTAALGLNRVKLPAPATGDYITPTAAVASTEVRSIVSRTAIRRHASGVTNEANIYDSNAATFANPAASVPGHTASEIIVWDLGSLLSRTVSFNHNGGGTGSGAFSVIQTSPDDITWTNQSRVETHVPTSGSFTVTFRFIRWLAENSAPTTNPPSGWALNTLETVPKGFTFIATDTIDDNLATQWRPSPANEAGAWCRWDTGALRILGGCRIFWGADAAFRPNAYRLEVSEDGATWTIVVNITTMPPASAWREYSWNARFARFIRLVVVTHGASGTEIFEMDFYSRLVDRVAAEHGHGSGITPHLEVLCSPGHPEMGRGATLRKNVRNLASLIEYVDFMLKD